MSKCLAILASFSSFPLPMSAAIASHRSSAYQPKLAWATAVASTWVFVLVMLGAFTTSIGAGMVFPDWPLSNGSLNPEGWLNDIAMFAEHSHRLSAGLMSVLTFGIALAVWRYDSRAWLRKLAWFAVGFVFAQALIGGLRVLFDHLHIEMVNTSVGRIFAMMHACLAQLYVCTLLAVTLSLTKAWMAPKSSSKRQNAPHWRRLAVICVVLLVLQLAVAAVMRHSFAGLAILTFPYSTPQGGLLPEAWNFRVGIHFTHRLLAVVLTVALVALAIRISRDRLAGPYLKQVGWFLVSLLAFQISLGAASVLTYRNPYYTTAHVIVGALTLATCFGLAWWSFRDNLQAHLNPASPLATPEQPAYARR